MGPSRALELCPMDIKTLGPIKGGQTEHLRIEIENKEWHGKRMKS